MSSSEAYGEYSESTSYSDYFHGKIPVSRPYSSSQPFKNYGHITALADAKDHWNPGKEARIWNQEKLFA